MIKDDWVLYQSHSDITSIHHFFVPVSFKSQPESDELKKETAVPPVYYLHIYYIGIGVNIMVKTRVHFYFHFWSHNMSESKKQKLSNVDTSDGTDSANSKLKDEFRFSEDPSLEKM